MSLYSIRYKCFSLLNELRFNNKSLLEQYREVSGNYFILNQIFHFLGIICKTLLNFQNLILYFSYLKINRLSTSTINIAIHSIMLRFDLYFLLQIKIILNIHLIIISQDINSLFSFSHNITLTHALYTAIGHVPFHNHSRAIYCPVLYFYL